jgi:hypothetical protein
MKILSTSSAATCQSQADPHHLPSLNLMLILFRTLRLSLLPSEYPLGHRLIYFSSTAKTPLHRAANGSASMLCYQGCRVSCSMATPARLTRADLQKIHFTVLYHSRSSRHLYHRRYTWWGAAMAATGTLEARTFHQIWRRSRFRFLLRLPLLLVVVFRTPKLLLSRYAAALPAACRGGCRVIETTPGSTTTAPPP